ncbi:uncharacterized protein SPAPADRAFT_64526 [Spathaspora passalidarum NRRL Y-27907]|uniref:Uncharacterized protein n=1 Tax=Spathaspora passalidarum (strain NRRL Y-27907 / 11-Y1) TaxID=619300 RepID=G3AGR5_SPAPN|nr:uncharacterized protein SPAPADRAFT_64526 [Spathaspora passalidarum NRRL Y-27907]EGW35398.1 hypothetical protein SPAPADRAFT_64526 [Spathaspora passalidarum NRRL Y-27907]
MTTPIISPSRKHTHHTKHIIDETLSPVKINLKPVETPPIRNPSKNDVVLIQHPHGLHAKHEARRNTFGHKRRSLVNTPLIDVKSRRDPMTSPYVNQGISNLDSIKRSKLLLDSQFEKLGKENRQPKHLGGEEGDDEDNEDEAEALSSPIKRPSKHKDEPLRKIAKLVTSAESEVIEQGDDDNNNNNNNDDDDDDVILDDLVERFSKPASSHEETSSPLVIDSSDNEELETDKPADTKLHAFDHTQLNKIIQDHVHIDYVTPQRYTEPVAKSPGTNQISRINGNLDLKNKEEIDKSLDSTSPLKQKQLDENVDYYDDETIHRLENEPTINFLMSPNSRPLFSIEQMNKIQQENSKRNEELIQDIKTRDDTIQLLSEQVNKLQGNLVEHQHQLRELKKTNGELVNIERVLSIQLKHNERELASLTKSFKIKESSVFQLSQELSRKSNELTQVESQFTDLTNKVEEIQHLKDDLIEMNDLNEKYANQIDSLIKERNEIQTQNDDLQGKLETESSEWKDKYEQLNQTYQELKDTNDELRNQLDDVSTDLSEANGKNEDLKTHLLKFETEVEQLTTTNEQLTMEKEKLTAANQENEKLIKEYDEITNNRIADLEQELEETRQKEEREKENSIQLGAQLEEFKQLNKKLEFKIEDLDSEAALLKEEITRLETLVKDKTALVEEKDQIISDDMIKLNELVQAVTESREHNNEEVEDLHKQIETLSRDHAKEIQRLQEKLETSQAEADQEFNRLAQYLHHEYSEKHAKKLGEVKVHFERERDGLIRDKKAAEREAELLKRKVNHMTSEMKKMTEIYESQTSGSRHRSPNK